MLIDISPPRIRPTVGSVKLDLSNPFTQGLKGLWLMNAAAKDLETNMVFGLRPDIAATAVTYVPSAQGLAASFDGTTSLLRYTAISPFLFNDNVLVFAIVKITSATNIMPIVGVADVVLSRGYGAKVYNADSSGRLWMGKPIGFGNIGTSTTAVSAGAWTAVMIHSGTNLAGTYRRFVYSSGSYAEETVADATAMPLPQAGDEVRIGTDRQGNFFAGNILYIGLWRRPPFSAAEFMTLASSPYVFLKSVPTMRSVFMKGSQVSALVEDQDEWLTVIQSY